MAPAEEDATEWLLCWRSSNDAAFDPALRSPPTPTANAAYRVFLCHVRSVTVINLLMFPLTSSCRVGRRAEAMALVGALTHLCTHYEGRELLHDTARSRQPNP